LNRFIKAFTSGDDCQRGSVLFSADRKREDAVKDAKCAAELAAEDRLKLVVAMDSSEDDDDDDDGGGSDDDDNNGDESMEVDDNIGKYVFCLLVCYIRL